MEKVLDFIKWLIESDVGRTFIGLWIAERFQALASERNKHDLKAAEAIEYGEKHPGDPHGAKSVMGGSKEGQSLEFNAMLDKVSPLLEPRVSKKKKIGRFLLKCLPIVSRFL